MVFESLCDVKKTKKGDQEGLEFYLKDDIGKIMRVRIKNSNRNSLFGEVITNSDQKVA